MGIGIDPKLPIVDIGGIIGTFVDLLRAGQRDATEGGVPLELIDVLANLREKSIRKESTPEQIAWIVWIEATIRFLKITTSDYRSNSDVVVRVPEITKSEMQSFIDRMAKEANSGLKLEHRDIINPSESRFFEIPRQEFSKWAAEKELDRKIYDTAKLCENFEIGWRSTWRDDDKNYEAIENTLGRAYLRASERREALRAYSNRMIATLIPSDFEPNAIQLEKELKSTASIIVVRGGAFSGKTTIAKSLCGKWIEAELAATCHLSLAGPQRTSDPLEEIQLRLRANIGPTLCQALDDGVWSLGSSRSILFCDDLDRMEAEHGAMVFIDALKRRLETGPIEICGREVRLVLLGRPSIADHAVNQLPVRKVEFFSIERDPSDLRNVIESEFQSAPRFATKLNDRTDETESLLRALAIGGNTSPLGASHLLNAMGKIGPRDDVEFALNSMIDRLPIKTRLGGKFAIEPQSFGNEIAAETALNVLRDISLLPDVKRHARLAPFVDYADPDLPHHLESWINKKLLKRLTGEPLRENLRDSIVPFLRTLLDLVIREGGESGSWEETRLTTAENLFFQMLGVCSTPIQKSRDPKMVLPAFLPNWPDRNALRRILRRSRENEGPVLGYLSDMDISNQSLSAIDLRRANFRRSIACKTDFSEADFGPETSFKEAIVAGAKVDQTEFNVRLVGDALLELGQPDYNPVFEALEEVTNM